MAPAEIITKPVRVIGISPLRSGRKRLLPTSAGHSSDVREAKDVWQDRLLILGASASQLPPEINWVDSDGGKSAC